MEEEAEWWKIMCQVILYVTSETGSVLAPNALVCFAVLFAFAGRLTGEAMLTDSVAFLSRPETPGCGMGEPDRERLIPNLNQKRKTAVTRKERDWNEAS